MPSSELPDTEVLFDASPNAYVLLDKDLTIVKANETYLEVAGREREEIIGQHVFEAFPGDPEDPDDPNVRRLKASFERVLSTGEPDSLAMLPYTIPQKTDEGETAYEERYWSATHTPIFEDSGEVAFILQHTTDVTDLYKTKEKLQDLQEKEGARKKGDSSQQRGREEPQGPEREAAGSAGSPPVSGGSSEDVLPEEPEKTSAKNDRGRRSRVKQVEKGVLSRAEAVQRAYWNSEMERERLQRLFDQAPGFMCFQRGPDHVYELANDAYLELIDRQEIIGRPVREVLPELEEQGFFDLLDQVYESGESFVGREVEARVEKESGEGVKTVYVDFVYQPVAGPEGEVIGIFTQGHDVTEQKRAKDRLRKRRDELKELNETLEERVEERTRQVRKLTSHVTRAEQRERRRISRLLHDNLQQRLYGSQLQVQSLCGSLEEHGQDKLADEAEAAASGIEEVIRAMRRLSVGMSPPVLEREGLTAALEWLRSHMEEIYGLEVELKAEREFHLQEEMRVLLFQTTRELLSNVAKHAGVGEATVKLFEEESDLVLEVSDEGEGFDPEQVDIRDPEGSFGLTAARERLRLFDGNLTAQSVPGKGTRVTVRLPLEKSLKGPQTGR